MTNNYMNSFKPMPNPPTPLSNPTDVPNLVDNPNYQNYQQRRAAAQMATGHLSTLHDIYAIQDPAQKANAWAQAKERLIASGLQGASQLNDDPERGMQQAHAMLSSIAGMAGQP